MTSSSASRACSEPRTYGAAEAGEVLATAARIKDGDADSWLSEWTATAGALLVGGRRGRGGRASRQRAAATTAVRRPTTRPRSTVIAHTSEPERQLDLWRRQRACWDHVVDLLPVPGERIEIPYEDTTLPGVLLPRSRRRARRGAAARRDQQRERRRDVEMWLHGGAAAQRARLPLDDVRRARTAGRAVRAGPLLPARLGGRPDARRSTRCVARPDVDRRAHRGDRRQPGRLLGAARARVRAPLRSRGRRPGRRRRLDRWTGPLPRSMRNELSEGKRHAFDRDMHLGELSRRRQGHAGVPRRALRHRERLALRPLSRRVGVPPRRRGASRSRRRC